MTTFKPEDLRPFQMQAVWDQRLEAYVIGECTLLRVDDDGVDWWRPFPGDNEWERVDAT